MRRYLPYHNVRSGAAGLLIAVLLLTACSSSSSPTLTVATSPTAEIANLTVERTVLYATYDDEPIYLDVYVPIEPGPRPVVLVVHGAEQTRATFADLAEAISSQGAVVYNIGVMDTFPWSTGIENITCAVRFARATAADYGGDPSRITLVGNSFGAATGVVVALAGDDFEGDCVVPDGSALLDALIAFEGPYDYATTVRRITFDHASLKEADPELWQAINPYSHIGRNLDLQVRLIYGDDEDKAWFDVRPEVSIELHQALADAGYDVELIIVEGASHIALTNKYSDAFALTLQQVMELARSSSQ